MSEIAVAARSERQRWAAPGGRHDRLVAFLSRALPVAIGILSAFVVVWPLFRGGDSSFLLDKNKVDVAHERLKLQTARYRGTDTRGQPFELTAGSAVQRSSSEPIVRMNDLYARLGLSDGPATVRANSGRYDLDTEQVKVDGPIAVRGTEGYRLDTRDATMDLNTRRLIGTGAATGAARQGTFSGDTMSADLERRTVTLKGNARLRIVPGAPR